MKNKLFTLIKILITVALIVYIFSKVDLAAVIRSIAAANIWLVLLALLFYMEAIAINGIKWYVLLRAQDVYVPISAVLAYIFEGFFFNNVLPANIGGDVMRGYEMAKYTEQTAKAAVSVIVDRMMGLIAYMSAAAVTAILVVIITAHPELQSLLYMAFVALAAIAAVLAILLSRRLRALVGRLFHWRLLAPLGPIYERISSAFDAYRFRYRSLILAFFISLAGLMVANFVNWFLFLAVGADVELAFIFLFNPLIALVLLIPISVGGHGVIQNAYPFFYGLVGVPEAQAVAVSVLMSFVIITGSLPGGLFWLRNRRAAAKDARQAVT